MADAVVADQAAHLLHPLDDVIIWVLFVWVQAFILLHLPAQGDVPSERSLVTRILLFNVTAS